MPRNARRAGALAIVWVVLQSLQCGPSALAAKDVSSLSLAADATLDDVECTWSRALELGAQTNDGKQKRSTASGGEGIDVTKNLAFHASVGTLEVSERGVVWVPPKDLLQLANQREVTVTASLLDDPSKRARTTFQLGQKPGCKAKVWVGGEDGINGASGSDASPSCHGGANGGPGGNGGNGGNGGAVRVEATYLAGTALGDLVLYRIKSGRGESLELLRADSSLIVGARGGDGGSGGSGGRGCSYANACGEPTHSAQAGSSGNGGSGGNGGNGADVTLALDAAHPELEQRIIVDVSGGAGGSGGSSPPAPKIDDRDCKAQGQEGSSGREGMPGREGTIRVEGRGAPGSTRAAPSSGIALHGTPNTTVMLVGAGSQTVTKPLNLTVDERGANITFAFDDCALAGKVDGDVATLAPGAQCSTRSAKLTLTKGMGKRTPAGWTVSFHFNYAGAAKQTGTMVIEGSFTK